MEQLAIKDFTLLIEALDCWENKPSSSAMVSSMMTAVLLPDKDKVEESTNKIMDEAKEKVVIRKERATLLKAKLLAMRDAVDLASLEKEAI